MLFCLDTNIFIRTLALESKKEAKECQKILELVRDKKLKAFIPGIILAEIAWTLKSPYMLSKEKISSSLKGILILSGLKMSDKIDYQKACELFSEYNVKFIDCLIASHREILNGNAIIISYDKDFDKLGIKRMEPRAVVKRLNTG